MVTTNSGPARPGRLGLALSLLVVLATALALRARVANVPLERDEGEYAYIAQRWLLGEVPYKDSFDQKPPGTFAVYAVLIRLLGPSPSAIHWGAQLYTLGTLACLVLLGRRLVAPSAGALAGVLGAFLLTDPCVYGNAANTETFMILPLTAGALAALRAGKSGSVAWALATGLLGGAALLCKQVALFNVLFLRGWALWHAPRRRVAAPALLLGAVLPPALVALGFCAAGAGNEFYDCVIGYNLSYAARVPFAEYPTQFAATFGPVLKAFWPVFVAATLFALLTGARLATARGRVAGRPGLFLLLWLGSAWLATATGGQFFYHYYIAVLPPTALLAAAGLISLAGRVRAGWARAALPWLAAAGAVAYAMALSPWYYFAHDPASQCVRIYGRLDPTVQAPAVADFVAARSRPNETVFVAGSEPEIYYYARRKCASRYIFVYPLLNRFPDVAQRQRLVLEELRRQRPALLVTVFVPVSLHQQPGAPPQFFDELRRLLGASYRVAAVCPIRDGVQQPLVTGDEASRLYAREPMWYDHWTPGATRWSTMVVWERAGERGASAP